MANIHWEGVNEFVAVAESGSFTQAATRLETSVANVSRRVGQLEERLGVKLCCAQQEKCHSLRLGRSTFSIVVAYWKGCIKRS